MQAASSSKSRDKASAKMLKEMKLSQLQAAKEHNFSIIIAIHIRLRAWLLLHTAKCTSNKQLVIAFPM
jgi:hypothetical protein